MPRFLLISRIGPASLHPEWLMPEGARNFDVLLSVYDPSVTRPNGPGIHTELRPGQKVAGYAELLKDRKDWLSTYDFIAFFDDDISASAETLSRMFEICEAHQLKIAQPTLTQDSYFSYASVLQQPGFLLRHTNFIEMMAPVFRSDVLPTLQPLFEHGVESGIDLIWCNLLYAKPTDFAVIDACPVRHTRPVGGAKEDNGYVGEHIYEDDIEQMLRRYQLPWLPSLPYQALRNDGRVVTSRWKLLLSALKLYRALPRPADDPGRLRKMLVHIKHLLTAPTTNRAPVLKGIPLGKANDDGKH